jgi:hypothetical protein
MTDGNATDGSNCAADIQLSGKYCHPEHCTTKWDAKGGVPPSTLGAVRVDHVLHIVRAQMRALSDLVLPLLVWR